MSSQPAPWTIYRDLLTHLKFGDALWEPSPHRSYQRVRPGYVGYINQGTFHFLFFVGDPPFGFESLDVGQIIPQGTSPAGHLYSETTRRIGADVGGSVAIAYTVEPGAKIAFELTSKRGAAIITKSPIYRERIELEGRFEAYMKKNYESWVELARERGHSSDVRPILVTGVALTGEFAMVAYSNKETEMDCEFSAILPGVASASVSVWGSWHGSELVHKNCGPDPTLPRSDQVDNSTPETHIPGEYTQCVFISYYTMRKKALRPATFKAVPDVLRASAGPHQLPKWDRREDDSGPQVLSVDNPIEVDVDPPESRSPSVTSDEVIHNVPTGDRDRFDIIAEFIFQNSDAKAVLLHHDDIQDFLEGDEEELSRLLAESRIAERVEVDENGIGQLGPAAIGSPKLNSSDFKIDTGIMNKHTMADLHLNIFDILTEADSQDRMVRDTTSGRTHYHYVDPHAQAEKQKRLAEAEANQVLISGIEFGWECRDETFSCEWEKHLDPLGLLGYDEDRREFRITFGSKSIAMRSAQIDWASCGTDDFFPVICFALNSHPIFEEAVTSPSSPFKRTRISSLDPDHERVVPFASLAVRFICDSSKSLKMFHTLCRTTPLGEVSDKIYHRENRDLFSVGLMGRFDSWLARLDFEVAFQVEKIVRGAEANFQEILALEQEVEDLVRSKGVKHTVGVLRSFQSALREYSWNLDPDYIPGLFHITAQEYVSETKSLADMALEDTFPCYHVSVTPTAMMFNGPFQERSNRVFRRYPDHHSCFIRVTFEEETRLQLRFDREVDGATFVKRRYGEILRDTGLKIGGRKYWFLAYSQSALKEHSVWFMRPFRSKDGTLIDPAYIIDSLGDFENAPDPKVIYCPGRYGARISQAFTSTDSGVSVQPEEIREVDDVEVEKVTGDPSSGKYNFTDGVGTISPELAKVIWDTIRAKRRNARRIGIYPKCFQIRFQGCKGMVSVDYRQTGRELVLRPSMIKFQAPKWSEIEIARAFDRPSPFYLNRPLIMVLEGLGVEYATFKMYQDGAVREAQDARQDFERAGRLLESFGLGASFRLPSIMYNLHKLGVPMQKEDPFYKHLMDFAINHVLRELKHHARIPIPGYTLVGVADVHGWLQPDEVFACIVDQQTKKLQYLEGDMVITRSPVIHPGDVQIVRAIGKPPPGSPFEKEPLPNAVVFSIKGDRPIPSKTGGGDLDGDVYNIASLQDMPIRRTYPAAAYTDAPKKILDRKCTMGDVADFVTDYINSDVLGLVATNWLIIADQSSESIFDKDCMTLAQLHSDAVDYPKSSTPVLLEKIPRLKFKTKPDWIQPETMSHTKSADYYDSQRAIGRLFRAIELPALDIVQKVDRRQRKKMHEEDDDFVTHFGRMSVRDDDQVDVAVCGRVTEFIDADVDHDHRIRAFNLFERYTAELKTICVSHTISYRRDAMLTEEEAVVGTIVARTSQPRQRRDMISKLRDQTNLQVKGVRNELISEEDGFETNLEKAWALWRVTQEERESMGARSLGLIALGVIFDTIKEFEEELKG